MVSHTGPVVVLLFVGNENVLTPHPGRGEGQIQQTGGAPVNLECDLCGIRLGPRGSHFADDAVLAVLHVIVSESSA